LLLMIPTLIGIMAVTFLVVQFAPGGPVEQVISQLQGMNVAATARISGGGGDFAPGTAQQQGGSQAANTSRYRGAQGLDPTIIARLEKQFGFDKPPLERFALMLWNYARFDFGNSYFRDVSVLRLIREKLPVSISLGLWMTLISYLISIPLGIRKALKDGTPFDTWTSAAIIVGYAIPGFLFAILLIILFAGGNSFPIGFQVGDTFYGFHLGCGCFPLRGLWSDHYARVPWYEWITDPRAIADYFWHLALPLAAMAVGAFATTTMLTKNSFLDEIRKQYVMTARAKGLTESRVLYGHVFRNAMLIVIAGFPGAFIGAFFGASLLIETIFSLDGLGLLGFESVVNRDYPVVFATLYMFSLIGLVVGLISDMTYTWIDPRIDFATREV
jgi:microcin C transport system permease protein